MKRYMKWISRVCRGHQEVAVRLSLRWGRMGSTRGSFLCGKNECRPQVKDRVMVIWA